MSQNDPRLKKRLDASLLTHIDKNLSLLDKCFHKKTKKSKISCFKAMYKKILRKTVIGRYPIFQLSPTSNITILPVL